MRLGFYVTGSADCTYADLVEQVEYLDGAGFDSVWLRERHFHRDHGGRNFFSSPLTVAAHLAQRTERIRLGLGARILPLDHPLRIAEDTATLDHLAGGRLDLGIARIGEQELYQRAFGTTGEVARERFEEALDVILAAWSGEEISASGRHWSFPPVTIAPAPLQRPHPPVFLVGISESTLRLGARRGFPLLLAAAQPVDDVARTQDAYAELLAAAGRDPETPTPLNRFVYVGEDDRRAEADMRDAVLTFVNRPNSVIRDFLGLAPDEITPERLLHDVFIVGGPATCAERIAALRESVRVDELLCTFNYFSLGHDRCRASMERFVEEVVPAVAGGVAAAA